MGAVSCEHAPAHETHRAGLEGTLPLLLLTLPFNMAQGWTFNVQALDMGLINTVVPLDKLQEETTVWCREILRNSPTALRVLKAALNAAVSPHLWQFISCALCSPTIHLSSASGLSHTSPLRCTSITVATDTVNSPYFRIPEALMGTACNCW